MTRLRATFSTPAALVAAHDQEMTRGGLLVRGVVPADVTLFAEVELEIVAGTRRLLTGAQVVQMAPGVGVAVTFSAAKVPGLPELVAAARALGASPWSEPKEKTSVTDKIQLALHGNRDERAAILRDTNRMLHPYVLKNPNLGLDEVAAMARMSTISADALKQIAERREWVSRPDVAIALVRNPTVPVPVALRALEYVSVADLRQLAKDNRTRPAILQAARRKVLG